MSGAPILKRATHYPVEAVVLYVVWVGECHALSLFSVFAFVHLCRRHCGSSSSVGVVVLGRHCCCRFKGGSASEGGREEGGMGREAVAVAGHSTARRHIHPDRHCLSVCRHPTYYSTQRSWCIITSVLLTTPQAAIAAAVDRVTISSSRRKPHVDLSWTKVL